MGSGADLKDVINRSITQTLSRSIFTSLTTFIMVAALYVLGVTAIREFALPLMVGIACGTYSSVFLAHDAEKQKGGFQIREPLSGKGYSFHGKMVCCGKES